MRKVARVTGGIAAAMVMSTGLAWHPSAASAAAGSPALPAGCDSGTLVAVPWECVANTQSINGLVTYTGVNPTAVPPNAAADPNPVNTDKLTSYAAEFAFTETESALYRIPNPGPVAPLNNCPEGGCPPPSAATNQPLQPQQTNYTCGPSATRLVVWQITGADHGEQTYTDYEGTTRNYGTSVPGVKSGLNRDVPANQRFGIVTPEDPEHLMNIAVTDIVKYNSSLIESVETSFLPFWHMQPADHFDIIYGYDLRNGTLQIDDEFSGSYGWGSPYGSWVISDDASWNAIHGSWSGQILA